MAEYDVGEIRKLVDGELPWPRVQEIMRNPKDRGRLQAWIEIQQARVDWDERILLPLSPALFIVESGDENPEEYVENRELGSQIERAIGELRPEYRTVILLRHVEGYAYDEISSIMELPLGTVKTYLHRARGELKELLAHLTS